MHGEGEVGVAGRVERAQLDPGRVGLAGLVHRHPHERRAVGVPPADVRRRLDQLAARGVAEQPLVRVHPLVGDRGDLARVPQQAGDERLRRLGQVQLVGRVVEGVVVALEQRQVGVHAAARAVPERLGHERGVRAVRDRDLFDHVPERHDVVGHRQRVGVAQVDLLLARRDLVVAELDRDAERPRARRRRRAGSRARRRGWSCRSSRRCRSAPARSRPSGGSSAGRTRSRGGCRT